jgi:hypothetical protein
MYLTAVGTEPMCYIAVDRDKLRPCSSMTVHSGTCCCRPLMAKLLPPAWIDFPARGTTCPLVRIRRHLLRRSSIIR